MAIDSKRFRIDEVETGEDRGLFRLYELREVDEKEKELRDKSAHKVWYPVKTFQTRKDAEAYSVMHGR